MVNVRLVHEVECVGCQRVEYMATDGKSARKMKGICETCDGVRKTEKAKSEGQPKDVPPRKSSAVA